ncbi:MAG: AbrB/MazE/SpoVT family DNA-binding domain-containing protein [Chloroflexota bacterium]|nr:AbrB/MazE/SpoVT family DNA-binding domain-containing protein [Chloroflexota bacterium]
MSEQEPMSRLVRPLRGGQITIPADFRERLGIGVDSLLRLTLSEGELRIRPVQVTQRAAGSPWLKDLYDAFAPVREEARRCGETEIDRAIGEAVEAVRRNDA